MDAEHNYFFCPCAFRYLKPEVMLSFRLERVSPRHPALRCIFAACDQQIVQESVQCRKATTTLALAHAT